MTEMPHPEEVELYRIENPNIAANPDGITSHEDLVGQWFTPNLETATGYLRKSTQTFGKDAHPVDGAQLRVAQVSSADLESYHVGQHPIASQMDVEGDNYLLPLDGSISIKSISLDEALDGLRGRLGNFENLTEAKRRIYELLHTVRIEHQTPSTGA